MMLVLIASAFAPVFSAPLECVVVPFISCHIATADLFVVLVEYAYWNNVRNDEAAHCFLSFSKVGHWVTGQCMFVR